MMTELTLLSQNHALGKPLSQRLHLGSPWPYQKGIFPGLRMLYNP